MSKILVVCYSRSGHTRRLAEAIVGASGWDFDPIVDTRKRAGWLGFLRSGFEAVARRTTTLAPPRLDPRDYDAVVVGSPIWGKCVSVPVRTYLAAHASELRRVAFFLTCGGSGSAQVISQMVELAGQAPLATLVLTERQLARGGPAEQAAAFVDTIRALVAPGVFGPSASSEAGAVRVP